MAVLLYFLTLAISGNNLFNMFGAKLVLCFYFFKLFARINKQNGIIVFSAFLTHNDTSRYTCSIKNISRQSDNSIYIVFIFNQETTYFTFRCTTEQDSVRSYTS